MTSLLPWAYVEEYVPEEGSQTPPEQLPLSKPGIWKPTSTMWEENTLNALETQARSSMTGGLCNEIPTCYVEEVPYMESTPTALETQPRRSMEGGLCEEFPTCYIEEFPYTDLVSLGTIGEIDHHEDLAAMDKGLGNEGIGAVTPSEVVTMRMRNTPREGEETPHTRAMHGYTNALPPCL